MPAWMSLLGGAVGAALITGIFGLIVWKLNRKAAKEDKEEARDIARFNSAVDKLEEVSCEIGAIKADVIALRESNQRQDRERMMDKALDARRRILQFADEIRRGQKHSSEHFNNVFEDIQFYKKYCDEHPDFENDKALISIKLIEQVYTHCIEGNDFL